MATGFRDGWIVSWVPKCNGRLQMSQRRVKVLASRLQRELVPIADSYIKQPHSIIEANVNYLSSKITRHIIWAANAIPIPEDLGTGLLELRHSRNSVLRDAGLLLNKLKVAVQLCKGAADLGSFRRAASGHDTAATQIKAMRLVSATSKRSNFNGRNVAEGHTLRARDEVDDTYGNSQPGSTLTAEDRNQLYHIIEGIFAPPKLGLRYNARLPTTSNAPVRPPQRNFCDVFYDPDEIAPAHKCKKEVCSYHSWLTFGRMRVQPHMAGRIDRFRDHESFKTASKSQ